MYKIIISPDTKNEKFGILFQLELARNIFNVFHNVLTAKRIEFKYTLELS